MSIAKKPNMLGPQASRAHLAHMSVDQFATGVDAVFSDEWYEDSTSYHPQHGERDEPSLSKSMYSQVGRTHRMEKMGAHHDAKRSADEAWESALSFVGSRTGSFSGYGSGRVYSSQPTRDSTDAFIPDGVTSRNPNTGKRAVWQTTSELN